MKAKMQSIMVFQEPPDATLSIQLTREIKSSDNGMLLYLPRPDSSNVVRELIK
jgi:hypothetical protein